MMLANKERYAIQLFFVWSPTTADACHHGAQWETEILITPRGASRQDQ